MQRVASADLKPHASLPVFPCRILSIGTDRSLLETRQLLLEQAGARVYSASFRAAALMAATDCFDIVLLCHTLKTWEVTCLRSLVARHHPGCRMISIDNLSQVRSRDAAAEHIVVWTRGPRELVEHILSLPAAAAREQLRTVQAIRE